MTKEYEKSNCWKNVIEFLFVITIIFGVFLSPSIFKTLQALHYYQEGKVLIKEGKYKEAIDAFDLAIKHRPNFPQALTNKGYALGKLGRHLEKLAACEQATKIAPDFVEAWNCLETARKEIDYALAWYNKGEALLKLGRYKEAISATQQVLKLEPDYFLAWTQICEALYELEQYQDAKTNCEESLNINPEYEPTKVLLEKIEKKLNQESFHS